MFGEFALFNRSAKGLLIVTTTSNGFSLANCRRFIKFAKLSTHQTFPLYGIMHCVKGNMKFVALHIPFILGMKVLHIYCVEINMKFVALHVPLILGVKVLHI